MAWDYRLYGSEGREADPIQGHDCDVFIEDPGVSPLSGGVGKKILLGSFNSAVLTLRFGTEPYKTFRQRIDRLLDGDIQIAFVLERGWIDTAVHAQTFGFLDLGRNRRVGRSPRLEISLNVDSNGALATQYQEWYLEGEFAKRVADGRIVLKRAKMDSLHIAVSAGKQVGVNQWQGLAEGYKVLPPIRGSESFDPSSGDYIQANYPMNSRAAFARADLQFTQPQLRYNDTNEPIA